MAQTIIAEDINAPIQNPHHHTSPAVREIYCPITGQFYISSS